MGTLWPTSLLRWILTSFLFAVFKYFILFDFSYAFDFYCTSSPWTKIGNMIIRARRENIITKIMNRLILSLSNQKWSLSLLGRFSVIFPFFSIETLTSLTKLHLTVAKFWSHKQCLGTAYWKQYRSGIRILICRETKTIFKSAEGKGPKTIWNVMIFPYSNQIDWKTCSVTSLSVTNIFGIDCRILGLCLTDRKTIR